RVEFAAGIAAGEVTVRHVGQDIVLRLDGGADAPQEVPLGDSLTLANWTDGGGALVETVAFADGTRWDEAEIKRVSLVGGAGTDQLVGYAGVPSVARMKSRRWRHGGRHAIRPANNAAFGSRRQG
ncbi:MAG: hypothetical protein HZB40_04700, partial [Rhodocyclales bacterium]|nr:hypothetical protein [Rhodocyclales bacterium]